MGHPTVLAVLTGSDVCLGGGKAFTFTGRKSATNGLKQKKNVKKKLYKTVQNRISYNNVQL